MVISEIVKNVSDILKDVSETNLLDAKEIVKHVLNIDNVSLVTKAGQEVSPQDMDRIFNLAKMRVSKMPMAYIVGHREFMSLDFDVSPGVLIPRPDTECVVEGVIEKVKSGSILDIGTGSGAIAVSLAKYIPASRVTALDVSEYAISVAKRNAEKNNVNVAFVNADIRDYRPGFSFDCIVSNPPYIETCEIDLLMSDVKDFEPHIALDGGNDGLDFYRIITEFAAEHLRKGGWLFYEMGWKQFDLVCEMLGKAGFSEISPILDLSGIKRGCRALKNF